MSDINVFPENWHKKDGYLRQYIKLPHFDEVQRLVRIINQISIELNHHGDVCYGFNYLHIKLRTHDQNDITSKDCQMGPAF